MEPNAQQKCDIIFVRGWEHGQPLTVNPPIFLIGVAATAQSQTRHAPERHHCNSDRGHSNSYIHARTYTFLHTRAHAYIYARMRMWYVYIYIYIHT